MIHLTPRMNNPGVSDSQIHSKSFTFQLQKLASAVSLFVLSRWSLVIGAALLGGACFGIEIGLATLGGTGLLAYFLPQKAKEVPISSPTPNLRPQQVGQQSSPFNPNLTSQPLGQQSPPTTIPTSPVTTNSPTESQTSPSTQTQGQGGNVPSLTRQSNEEIFKETLRACISGNLRESTTQMKRNARIIPSYAASLADPTHLYPTRFFVAPLSSFEMVRQLIQQGVNEEEILLLDMANRYKPGGEPKTAEAQEEKLCRQSNLFLALVGLKTNSNGYPIPELGGAFIPGVSFFRDDNYQFLQNNTPFFRVAVFASAAFDCNPRHRTTEDRVGYDRPASDQQYREGMKEKMRTMFRCARENGKTALVLGAFGCGAFANNPANVAQWYRDVLNEPEFRGAFRYVAFPVLIVNNSERDRNNFNTFHQFFAQGAQQGQLGYDGF